MRECSTGVLRRTQRVYTEKFTPTHKWCNHCQKMRPHSMFAGNVAHQPSGLQGYCREWNRLDAKERRRKKREAN